MNYRFARSDDIPAVVRLISHSFPSTTRTPNSIHEHVADPAFGGGPETLLLGEDTRGIAAACQVHPLRQWIAGEPFRVMGLGTVAISPTHRKQRHGATIVTEALRAGRERGDVASSLYPFRVSFYHRLGWGLSGQVLQYQVPPDALPDAAERHRIELLENDDARGEAFDVYSRWTVDQTGQLERTPRMWSRLFDDPDHVLAGFRADSGMLEGYALVLYRTDLPPRERFLEVEEIVWTSGAARRGLYGWLSSLGDQWQQIVIRALPAHRLGDSLREPRLPAGTAPPWRLWTPSATLLTGTMFRLLDVRAAFEGRRVEQGPTLAVSIELRDTQIEENRGCWRIALDAGRAIVERAGDVDLTVRLDVSTLSRLFIGSLSATSALDAGLLECDRLALLPALDAAFALPEAWTFDRF